MVCFDTESFVSYHCKRNCINSLLSLPLSIYELNNLLGEKTRWEEEFWPPTPEHVKEKQNQIKVIYCQ